MPACANCGEENPDRAKFCFDCGSPLTAAAPAPVAETEEERKLDTMLFVDLVGSTALAESLDPEDVLSLLQLYYTRLRADLERFGGTVEIRPVLPRPAALNGRPKARSSGPKSPRSRPRV